MSNDVGPEKRNGETVRRGAYPEFTWPAIIVGWILGAVIAISISYAALILGFSIEGSELAAILGWGILRGIMGRTSIIENNINQTVASAVNGASSGIMFSVPALLILSRKPGLESFADLTSSDILLLVFACVAGAFVGLAFVIPLRKQMIDFQRLPYPSGIAVATILKSPGAGMRKAMLLIVAGVISAVVFLVITGFGAKDHADYHVGQALGWPSLLNITFFGSLMTIGVGFLSGKGGFWFGAGGFICYWLLAPMMAFYAHEDVVQFTQPTIRQSIADVGTITAVGKAFEDYNQELEKVGKPRNEKHTALADKLFALAGIEKAKEVAENPPAESETNPDSESDAEVESSEPPKNKAPPVEPPAIEFPAILNVELANSANEAADALTALGKELKGKESREQRIQGKRYEELAGKLKSKMATDDVLASAKLLQEQPAILNSLNLLDAKQFIDTVNGLEIEPEQKTQLLSAAGAIPAYESVPGTLRSRLFRPTGIGMLIGAALGGILFAFPLIRSAIGSMRRASRDKSGSVDVASEELPIWMLFGAIGLGALLLIFLAYQSVPDMGLGLAITMALLGTLWIWIAGVIVAECIGRTNWSPLSGMTLIAVTILIVIAQAGQLENKAIIFSSLVVGAAICLAVSQASDMMLDLKSGYLVGATPKRQQMAQFVGAWLGPIIVIVLMLVLHKTKGIGSEALPAPQASALATVIEGIVEQDVPSYRYVAGGGLGFMLAASGLGGIGVLIALGFYMPFNIVLTYSIGCLLRVLFDKAAGKKFSEDIGIPIAAGLIVGEALMGVGLAIYKVAGGLFV